MKDFLKGAFITTLAVTAVEGIRLNKASIRRRKLLNHADRLVSKYKLYLADDYKPAISVIDNWLHQMGE